MLIRVLSKLSSIRSNSIFLPSLRLLSVCSYEDLRSIKLKQDSLDAADKPIMNVPVYAKRKVSDRWDRVDARIRDQYRRLQFLLIEKSIFYGKKMKLMH